MVPSTTCREELVERLDIVDRLRGCQCVTFGVFESYDGQRPRQQRQHVLDVLVGVQYRGWCQRPSWFHLETIRLVSAVMFFCSQRRISHLLSARLDCLVAPLCIESRGGCSYG